MKSKNLLFLPIVCMATAVATSCAPEVEPEVKEADFVITCDVKFAKNPDHTGFFEEPVFNINEYVFAYVDYTIKKAIDRETEKIAFKVEVPFAEYYANASYFDGNVEPKEDTRTEFDDEGNEIKVKHLECRAITFDDQEVHKFKYIFALKGNAVIENAVFKCRFVPPNNNLTTSMNGIEKENCHTVKYSFVEPEAK